MNKTIFGGVLLLFAFSSLGTASILYDATVPAPGIYVGSGIPATNYTLFENGNTLLGLTAINRFIGAIDPGVGSNTYDVTAGTIGGDASWDFGFLINTQNGGGTATLGDLISSNLTITDTTTSISNSIQPIGIPDDGCATGLVISVGPCTATNTGAENYENPSFGFVLPGFNPNSTDDYTLVWTVRFRGQDGSDTVGININAVGSTVPEPASMFLAGIPLFFLGFVAIRRRTSLLSRA